MTDWLLGLEQKKTLGKIGAHFAFESVSSQKKWTYLQKNFSFSEFLIFCRIFQSWLYFVFYFNWIEVNINVYSYLFKSFFWSGHDNFFISTANLVNYCKTIYWKINNTASKIANQDHIHRAQLILRKNCFCFCLAYYIYNSIEIAGNLKKNFKTINFFVWKFKKLRWKKNS